MKLARLSLWYARKRSGGGASLTEILSRCTPLYRLLDLWDGRHHPSQPDFPWRESGFLQLSEKLEELRSRTDADRFEEEGLAILLPHLEAGIDRDLSAWPWTPCGYCPYELPEDQVSGIFACEWKQGSDYLAIHIGNACLPDTPFHDLEARARELLRLLDAACGKASGLRFVGCNSWLNDFPPFRLLFPSEWLPPDAPVAPVGFGFNWWGQFMARDGRFHERNGRKMRETGSFPYLSKTGRCRITALRNHLAGFHSSFRRKNFS